MSLVRRLVGERRMLGNFGPWGAYQDGTIPPPWVTTGSPSGGAASDAGEWVNDWTALQQIAVFACVSLLADSVATLPKDAFRNIGGVRKEVAPQSSLLASPYAELTPFEWWHCVQASLSLRGNAYLAIVERDSAAYPTQLKPLHPDDVRVQRNRQSGRIEYTVGGDVLYGGALGEIRHLRAFTLPGQLEGLSPIGYARQAVGVAMAAERFGARFFGDSANPSSVLETEQLLDKDQVRVTQKSWLESHGGRRKPAVLTGGFKWRPISITPEESQFLETRRYGVAEIARLFRVPPHKIGDVDRTTSWGSGIEEQNFGFVVDTLMPLAARWEGLLTGCLPRPQYVKFNFDALLRGKTLDRYQAYLLARQAGLMNADEIRAKEDLAPIPDGAGTDFNQPLNWGPLGFDPLDAKKPIEPKETPQP